MAGKATATTKGKKLQEEVVALADRLGLRARTEVRAARRIWGAQRRIDVVMVNEKNGKTLGIECKVQTTAGSAEEKIPATVKDIEFWPINGIVVIDGEGFSKNMEGYLIATGKVIKFEDLEDWLTLYFGL